MSYNITSANDYITQFDPTATFNIDAPYTPDPANDYRLDDGVPQNYPRFAKLVNQLPQYLNANPSVLAAIMAYTGYSSAHIMQMVQPGQGPRIVLQNIQPTTNYGYYNSSDIYNTPGNIQDVFYVSSYWVNKLETSNSKSNEESIAFLLAVTIFHETVHLGRAMNGLPAGGNSPENEFGWLFEGTAYKVHVTPDNANQIYNYIFSLN